MPAKPQPETFADFDVDEEDAPTPCTFKLGGREWACRSSEQVPFHLIERMIESQGDESKVAVQVAPFFRSTLVPEQIKDFMAMLNADDSALTIGKVGKVMNHITTHVLNRPTARPSPSGAGSRTTRRTSKGASSSRATRAATG